MIIMSEVATKLQEILNGSGNPTNHTFFVETEGYHIDHIKKPDFSGNFIPVFISSMGGQFNPVKGLKQATYTYQVAFYFPVRFKEDLYLIADFMAETFVGSVIEYGTKSGRAVSNISVPQFGEIQEGADFREFEKWHMDVYSKPVEVMEPYLSMAINLYLSSSAPGFIYGNDIKYDLTINIGDKSYTLEDIDWDGASLQSNSQAQSEQEEETNESDSLPFGTTYGASYKVYPDLNKLAKNETNKYFYRELLRAWVEGNIQTLECSLTITIGDPSYGLVFARDCYIQSVVSPIERGQLFALTLTFAKKTDFDEE